MLLNICGREADVLHIWELFKVDLLIGVLFFVLYRSLAKRLRVLYGHLLFS